jgi:hypothetical protein
VIDYASLRRRDRARGKVYPVGPVTRDATAVVIGFLLWAAFGFLLHGPLIGVQPF